MTTQNLIIHRVFLTLSLFTLMLMTAQAQSLTEAAKADPTPTPQKLSATAKPTPAPTPAPLRGGGLTISGSVRARLESWNWFETSAANNNYNFGAVTLRLAVSQQREKFEWQVEGEFPWLINLPDNAIAPAPQGQPGLGGNYFAANGRQDASAILKQAYVRFKGIGGDKASSLKLGRFEFNDGTEITPTDATLATIKRDHIAQRLIGTFGFTHVGRSFDGVQYGRNAKLGNFTFLAARPTEGVFQLNGNEELDVDFYYGAFTKPFKFKKGESEMRAFALHYHDGRRVLKTDNRSAALRAADTDNIRITTLGGHYIGAYKAGSGKVDVLLWGAGQFGQWGRLDHRAGAIAAEAGYQFSGRLAEKIKPWVRAGYFRSTGDGDATDTTHGTYFQVLPTPRIYARFPFFNQMNNEDAFVQLRLKPHAKLSLRTDVHHLRLSSAKDLWYAGGGAFQAQTFGYAARPSNGKQSLGTLADVSIDCNVTSRSTLTFYLGGVRGGGVAGSIYPEGRNARFAYLEFTQRF
ncbi:MAG TPA: alginate export family protein [Blastocatellia bacterium]|nr:alginate export family protein [Blastocatellia bacterium]